MKRLSPRAMGADRRRWRRWSLDQGTKLLLLYGAGFVHMAPGAAVPVLPFFNLVMVWNPGHFLRPVSRPTAVWERRFWSLFSLVAVAGLGWWLWSAPPAGPWPSVSGW